MISLYKSTIALLFFVFSSSLFADVELPRNSKFFLEYSLDASGFKFRVNDVPVMSPSYQIGTMGDLKSRFPINHLLYRGKNEIEIDFKIKDESLKGARFRFSIKNSDVSIGFFSGADYVFDFKVNVNGDGNPLVIVESIGDQAISDVKFSKVEGSGDLEEWNSYRITFELAYDFYDSEYRDSAVGLSKRDYGQVVDRYKEIYDSFEDGTLKELLKNYLRKYSADTGMTEDEVYESLFSDYKDPELAYELEEFDASKSDLVLVGNGKLALLDPSPIYYVSANLGRKERIMIMLWKDKNGIWKIKD
jgi:hypothetical protein